MAPDKRQSILCPGCRKLISLSEAQCPYCGLSSPGSRWKNNPLTGILNDGERLIKAIIAVNVAMYLLSLLIQFRPPHLKLSPFQFLSPDNGSLLFLGATGVIPIDQYNRWWTIISANYLHGSLLHIVFNMMALRQIAALVIREYGVHRMFALYTLSGAAGFIVSYFGRVPFTIGASAAVCGLIGAALYYGRSRGGVYGQLIYRQIGGWVGSIFIFGFMIPGINNWAHGGGMLAGALIGIILGYHERRPERTFHRLLALGCILFTLAVLGWAVGSGFYYRMLI